MSNTDLTETTPAVASSLQPSQTAHPDDGSATLHVALTPSRSHASTEGLRECSAPGTPIGKTDAFETDIEAMLPHPVASQLTPSKTRCVHHPEAPDCQVWPGQREWKEKAKQAKMDRSCTCLARLGRRTRLAVKIIIALVVIGVAVGVGVGVSKALGAPIWRPHG